VRRRIPITILFAALLLISPAQAAPPEQHTIKLLSADPTGVTGDFGLCEAYSKGDRCSSGAIGDAEGWWFVGVGSGNGNIWESRDAGTTVASAGPKGAANDIVHNCYRIYYPCEITKSADGSFTFETTTALTADDTDTHIDVYRRKDGLTSLVTNIPSGNLDAELVRATPDFRHVLVVLERLATGEDGRDAQFAGFVERTPDGRVFRFPAGVPIRTGADFYWDASSPDLSRVLFATADQLVPEDRDLAGWDIYERGADGVVRLISTGPASSRSRESPRLDYASPDGSRILFSTSEGLVPEDGDGHEDVYQRMGGTTTLLTPGTEADANFAGLSKDGTHLFFTTSESLAPEDGDTCFDIHYSSGEKTPRDCVDLYERANGVTTLVSAGTASDDAGFVGASADGRHVFFTTNASLDARDADACFFTFGGEERFYYGCSDIYERSDGRTSLVSTGPLAGKGDNRDVYTGSDYTKVSDDGHITFRTNERLTADAPEFGGQYEWFEGKTRYLPSEPANPPGVPAGAAVVARSGDNARLIFTTRDSLLAEDRDANVCETYGGDIVGCPDLYELYRGHLTLLTGGTDQECYRDRYSGTDCPQFLAASKDPTRVIFSTGSRLVPQDTDDQVDAYVSQAIPHQCRDKSGKEPKKCAG
jgi:hypothetical protein